MTKQTSAQDTHLLQQIAVSVVLFAGACWALAAHWHVVSSSIHIAQTARAAWLVASIVLMSVTFCIAAAIYGVLALHRLQYSQTVLVEYAAAFVNRLLPSGLGGLGLHGVYLYKRKHTVADATTVVSVNNLIGIIGHLALLVGVGLLDPTALRQFVSGVHVPGTQQVTPGILLSIALLIVMYVVRVRIVRFIRNLLISVRMLSIRRVIIALILAMILTCTYVAILYTVARSLMISITLVQTFVIFSLGMLAGTATPTPGGLVGAEAGLLGALIVYGVPTASAGAVVLLYRLITYWLPLLPGLGALVVARRNHLV